MHPHAQHFAPDMAQEAELPKREPSTALTRFVVAAILFPLIAAGVIHFRDAATGARTTATAPSDPNATRIADRTEGFRAGLSEGLSQGCTDGAPLSFPLGLKP